MVGGVSQLISFLQKSLSTEKDEDVEDDDEEEKVNDEEEYDELTAVCTPGG